ncbi:sugar/nucleoside kinase (ribokinase family) [Pararhizobium capsulatum DSM 1112]|uniref:Sugar/nucleoside kinase (Ribokinase family) n=1 Tax=Pararhizobium capsulatum DSM 1112 TaxID=1121113 RepID=A0ABU0BQH7_9HYPH|nr:carbohydrate kinase family protein [Pararhizobium capsulatum]MDQ0320506.1 sugar/nucleoside kinase (ribokinase family) [Pararhizobium capsulatum DSM 1112]
MTSHTITVFGGAHIDRRGRIFGATAPGASNPGAWFEEAGGGGFNAARNLARLGLDVRMVSPRGGDTVGETVAAAALAAGVDDRPFIFLDRRTPSYTAIIENDGNLVIALADMELYNLFSPRRLQQKALRDALGESDVILTDANLPAETLSALTFKARDLGKLVTAIAISPAKVVRFAQSLGRLDFLFMNEAEARALTGVDVKGVAEWPVHLKAIGLNGGVITRGGRSVVAFAENEIVAVEPPPLDALGDVTGAGDALAAGFLFGRLQGKSLGESLRTGVAAAGITVASPLAVSENMTADALQAAMGLVSPAEILS